MAALKGYLTVKEVAERLGLSPNRVYQLVAAQRLDATRVGGKTLLINETAVKGFKRQGPGRPRKKAPKRPSGKRGAKP